MANIMQKDIRAFERFTAYILAMMDRLYPAPGGHYWGFNPDGTLGCIIGDNTEPCNESQKSCTECGEFKED